MMKSIIIQNISSQKSVCINSISNDFQLPDDAWVQFKTNRVKKILSLAAFPIGTASLVCKVIDFRQNKDAKTELLNAV